MKRITASTKMTGEEVLQSHALTRELKRLGVTDEQLKAMSFRGNNKGFPFEQWSFHFLEDMPKDARKLVMAYCTLKWLYLEDPPPSKERDDAWSYLAVLMAAPVVEIGLKNKETQSVRARKPRGKIDGSDRTLNQLIQDLAHNPEFLEQGAKELWPHFFSVLDEEGLGPEEKKSDLADKALYEYGMEDKRRSITFGRFANVVSEARKKSR